MSLITSCRDKSNKLDIKMNPLMDSGAMLLSLGDSPLTHELDKITAVHAKEFAKEFFLSKNREKRDSIPQFLKVDLVVGQFLGKGSFSEVFEVFAMVAKDTLTLESLGADRDNLNKILDAKFPRRRCSWGDIKEDSTHCGEVEGGNLSNHDNLDDKIDAVIVSTCSKDHPKKRTLSGQMKTRPRQN
jgi:hypothetical protein